jgi:hypothetical protein
MLGFPWFFLVFCRPGVLTGRGFGGSITKTNHQGRSPRPITKAGRDARDPRGGSQEDPAWLPAAQRGRRGSCRRCRKPRKPMEYRRTYHFFCLATVAVAGGCGVLSLWRESHSATPVTPDKHRRRGCEPSHGISVRRAA